MYKPSYIYNWKKKTNQTKTMKATITNKLDFVSWKFDW